LTVYEPGGDVLNPALKLRFYNSFVDETVWLTRGATIPLGPANIQFREVQDRRAFRTLLKKKADSKKMDKGQLIITLPGDQLVASFPVDKILGKRKKITGTDLTIKVARFFPHALVVNNELTNYSEKLVNPAVEFEISGPQGKERHVVFAFFPDFATLHQKTSKNYGIEARYALEVAAPSAGNTLTVFLGPNNQFIYEATSRSGVKKGRVKLGETIEPGWMDLKVELTQFFPNAIQRSVVSPLPEDSSIENPTPALHTTFKDLESGLSEGVWLQKHSEKLLLMGEDQFVIRYTTRNIPLGFQVELKDFVLKMYPGSTQPMSYESFVQVIDEKEGENFPFHIYMNHPLEYKGYKFFQSSYLQNPGEPEISIFSVNRDPGIPFIYGGSIILVTGIAILFFGRRSGREKKGK